MDVSFVFEINMKGKGQLKDHLPFYDCFLLCCIAPEIFQTQLNYREFSEFFIYSVFALICQIFLSSYCLQGMVKDKQINNNSNRFPQETYNFGASKMAQ